MKFTQKFVKKPFYNIFCYHPVVFPNANNYYNNNNNNKVY